MEDQQLNTFDGGMNLDLDNDRIGSNQYSFAEGFRHSVSLNNSLGNLEAMYGNIQLAQIVTPGCIKYSVNNKSSVDKLLDLVIITSNDTVLDFRLEEPDHNLEIDEILNLISDKIRTVILTAETGGLPANTLIYEINGNNFVIYGDIKEFLTYTNTNTSVNCFFKTTNSFVSKYIGSTEVREKTVLYAITNNGDDAFILVNESPDLSLSSITSVCKYIGHLNFSLDNPIVDSVINYESDLLCKIYFTDNHNPLRHFNIFDPFLMTRDTTFFDIISNVKLGSIKIEDIYTQSSSHKCGRIQYSFQYFNDSGQESTFSNPSNLVDLTTGNFNGSSTDYFGGDVDDNVNKQVKVTLWDLDSSFDNFRLISIFYSSYTSEAVIKIIHEGPIPLTKTFEFTDGNSVGENLAVEEVTLAGSKLFLCKTLEIKNNLLLVGNIKDKYEDYSTIDTRAYRFNALSNSSSAKLFDINEVIIPFVDLETTTIPIDADCKLPKINQFEYKYGKNKSNDTWMLGGSGKIISYNFVRAPMNQGNFTGSGVRSGFVDLESYLGEEYPNDSLYLDLTSPIKSGILSGYMRNEVYRFGIQFYDSKGRKSFVNWIGDIKFPAMSELDSTYITIDGTDIYDYRTSFVDSAQDSWAIALGIEFHVDKTQLPANISGYSIVRVDRTKFNKTELAQGIISGEVQDFRYGAEGKLTTKPSLYIPFSKNGESTLNGLSGIAASLEDALLKEFISPEISFNVLSNSDLSGKNINIVGSLNNKFGKTEADTLYDTFPNILTLGALNNPVPMHSRLYPNTPELIGSYETKLSLLSKKINNGVIVDVTNNEYNTEIAIGAVSFAPACQIVYSGDGLSQPGDNTYKGVIGKCAILDTENFNVSTISSSINPLNILIANISSDNISQYGGNSFYARSLNEYISCTHSRSIDSTQSILSNKIFGGDTYVVLYNHIKTQVRAGKDLTSVYYDMIVRRTHYSETVSFVVESSINTGVINSTRMKNRLQDYNNSLNKAGVYSVYTQSLNIISDSSAVGNYTVTKDAYVYNTVFSRNNTLLKFQAKPINLNDNQVFDTRILSSNRKINGETKDGWLVFNASEFIDLQNQYGEINKIINFGGQIVAFQDNAIGIASVDEKATVADVNSPGSIILGTGGILKRYDYISMTSGTKHQLSVCKTPTALYYHDSLRSKSMMFSGQENSFSESKGIQSLLNQYKCLSVEDIPCTVDDKACKSVVYYFNSKYREIEMYYILEIKGIAKINDDSKLWEIQIDKSLDGLIDLSTYFRYDLLIQNELNYIESNQIVSCTGTEKGYNIKLKTKPYGVNDSDVVIIKFGKSILYNELAGVVSGFSPSYPMLKFNINKNSYNIFKTSTHHLLHKENYANEICSFNGHTYYPKISYVVNKNIGDSKVFDSISMSSDITYLDTHSVINKNPINKIRCYNTHYNSGWMNGVDHGYTFGNRNEVMTRKFEDKWSISIPKNACKYTPDQIIDNAIDILDDDVSINFNRKFREKIDGKYIKIDLIFNTFKTNTVKRISWKLMNFATSFRRRF